MSKRPSVLILYNQPRPAGKGEHAESDAGVLDEVRVVEETLTTLGYPYRSASIRRLDDIPAAISEGAETLVFNLVESLHGNPADMVFVPAICEALGRPSTGGTAACQGLCLDKWLTKAALQAHGVPTPAACVVPVGAAVVDRGLPPFPVIVKPLATDASEGIDAASVVRSADDLTALANAVTRVHTRFGQPALVESFVTGREVNVSLMQTDGQLHVFPPAEIVFTNFPADRPQIVDYAAKWLEGSFEYENTTRRIPAELPKTVADEVLRVAAAAWAAVGCQDYARVDFRVAEDGRPFVIEVNPNPDISLAGGFAAALHAGGVTLQAFVEGMLHNAAQRRMARTVARRTRARQAPTAAPVLRWTEPRDRDPVLQLLEATRFFRADELETAREVLDDGLAHGPGGHYQSYVAEWEGRTVGWAAFGPTPCSVGCFDLYWIGVDPSVQGLGIGEVLLNHTESLIRQRGGRLIVAETSGRSAYASTRQFYLKQGYIEESRVVDFYAPADDKVVYVKRC